MNYFLPTLIVRKKNIAKVISSLITFSLREVHDHKSGILSTEIFEFVHEGLLHIFTKLDL